MYDFTKNPPLNNQEVEFILNQIDSNILKDKNLLTSDSHQWNLFFHGNKEKLKKSKNYSLCFFIDLKNQRFGNTYNSLLNISDMLEKYKIKKIYFQQQNTSLTLNSLFDLEKMRIVSTKHNLVEKSDELILVLTQQDCYKYKCLRNYSKIKPHFHIDAASYDLNTVVVHIRSGDIFYPGAPHRYYHQPPLAWYKYCIKQHIEKYGKSLIILIYENYANPVINALQTWCSEQGIEHTQSFSSSLLYDYRILFSAKVLIDSFGTFLSIVKQLSNNLELCYAYNDKYVTNYIARGEWKNTNEQRKLMLTLSEENLNITNFNPILFNTDSSSHIVEQNIPQFDSLFTKAITLYENASFAEAKEAFLECALYYPKEHNYREYLNKCFREEENYEMLKRNARTALQAHSLLTWAQYDIQIAQAYEAENEKNKPLQKLELQNKLLKIICHYTQTKSFEAFMLKRLKSVKGVLLLPLSFVRAWKKEYTGHRPKEIGGKDFAILVNIFKQEGFEAAKHFLISLHQKTRISTNTLAYAYAELAREAKKEAKAKQAIEIQWLAFETNPSYYHLKWLAFHYCDAQDYATAKTILELLPEDNPCSEFEKKKIMGIMNFVKL